MGKGSKRRPENSRKFAEEWSRIFENEQALKAAATKSMVEKIHRSLTDKAEIKA